jgi:CubicO group peptidase (beta-lactamase class C family)
MIGFLRRAMMTRATTFAAVFTAYTVPRSTCRRIWWSAYREKDTSWLPTKGQVGFGIDFAVRIRPPVNAAEASAAVGEFFRDGAADTLFWVDPKNKITAVLFTQYRPFGKVALHKAFRDAVYSAIPDALAK